MRQLNTQHYRETLNHIWTTQPKDLLATAQEFLNVKDFEISLAGDI